MINCQIVNGTAPQCVADKYSRIGRPSQEMVGFDGRQIPNCGLLQTRLWELRPDEDRPRAFFHFKLSSPFPDSDHSTCVSTRSFPFFHFFFFTRSCPFISSLIACRYITLYIFAGTVKKKKLEKIEVSQIQRKSSRFASMFTHFTLALFSLF